MSCTGLQPLPSQVSAPSRVPDTERFALNAILSILARQSIQNESQRTFHQRLAKANAYTPTGSSQRELSPEQKRVSEQQVTQSALDTDQGMALNDNAVFCRQRAGNILTTTRYNQYMAYHVNSMFTIAKPTTMSKTSPYSRYPGGRNQAVTSQHVQSIWTEIDRLREVHPEPMTRDEIRMYWDYRQLPRLEQLYGGSGYDAQTRTHDENTRNWITRIRVNPDHFAPGALGTATKAITNGTDAWYGTLAPLPQLSQMPQIVPPIGSVSVWQTHSIPAAGAFHQKQITAATRNDDNDDGDSVDGEPTDEESEGDDESDEDQSDEDQVEEQVESEGSGDAESGRGDNAPPKSNVDTMVKRSVGERSRDSAPPSRVKQAFVRSAKSGKSDKRREQGGDGSTLGPATRSGKSSKASKSKKKQRSHSWWR